MKFWERWLIQSVIAFALRQLAKFKDSIDWAKVKEDVEVRVRKLIPGTWFDDEGVAIANAILDRAQVVISSADDIKEILDHVAASEWEKAWDDLRDLLLEGWAPEDPTGKKVAAVVKDLNVA